MDYFDIMYNPICDLRKKGIKKGALNKHRYKKEMAVITTTNLH